MTSTPPTSQGFLRNLMAYSVSEVAAKSSRLLVVIAISRSMDVAQIGLAAAAMAAGDILKSLTENGVGQRIIAAQDRDLEATCVAARRIFWAWCLGLFAVQMLIAALVVLVLGNPLLGGLIALLAAEYLFMPAGLVQAALAMREGRLQQTAMIAGGQVVGANLMSALLVFAWPSALALVLPRLLAAPIWLVAMRRLRPWRKPDGVRPERLRPFVRYGAPVLGVEIVKALRLQADKLVVGLLLGAEVLGLYFMAFNAGLSLATSFSMAFSTVVFPHLCASPDRTAALRQSMVLAVAVITPIVVLQALLAPVYVPMLFGPGWDGISTVVSILCLSAIPALIWSAAAGWFRANGQPQAELHVTVALAVALVLNIVLMAPLGLSAIAWGYLAVSCVVMIGGALPALTEAFHRNPART
ncbi:oligosaccharide flippase family protein [Seohaeicola saemankumensis]|nr:oligosaccharide flippase family protein [Seohaeicola saemankumensis]MCA0872929.1 oligosaccharide flippase family protein [Seohaeicola saemankumensis]